ncbi:MAG: tetratricopeptide repeat protein [Planctomycetota bacterium]
MRAATVVRVLTFSLAVGAAGALIFPSPDEVTARLEQRGDQQAALDRVERGIVRGAGPQGPARLLAAAEQLERHGRRLAAISAVERLIGEDPSGPGHWLRLARLRAQDLDLAGERVALERAVELCPGHLPAWERLAAIYRYAQEPGPLLDALERLIAGVPAAERAVWLRERAGLRLGRGEAAAGTDDLDRYLALGPEDAEAWRLRLDLAALEGEASAAAVSSRVLLAKPGPPEPLELVTDALESEGLRALARGAIEWALARAPRDEGLLERALQAAEAAQDLARAAELARRLVALAPRDPRRLLRLAGLLTDAGQLEAALAAMRAAIALAPDDPRPCLDSARLLLDAGRPAEACDQLRALLRRDPEHALAQALLLQAALAADDLPLAAELLGRQVERHPQDSDLARQLADVELWRGELGAAAKAWSHLFELKGELAALRQLAQLHEWREDPAAEGECRRALLQRDPSDQESAFRLADLASARGLQAGEQELLERFVATTPAAAGVRRLLAATYLEHGQPAAALPHLQALRAAAPDDRELWRLYLEALAQVGRRDLLQRELQSLLARDDLEWLRFAGELALQLEELDIALQAYQLVVARDPRDADAAFLCGQLATWRSRHALAAGYLQLAVQLRPEHGVAHALLADCLENLDPQDPGALRHYREAFRLLPADARRPAELFHRAYAAHRVGQDPAALRALRRLIELSPQEADRLPARLLLVRVLAARGELEGARRELLRARASRRPEDEPVLLAAEAWLEQAAGSPARALELYERVTRDPRADLGPVLEHAQLLERLGRSGEASRLYERVVRESRRRKAAQ